VVEVEVLIQQIPELWSEATAAQVEEEDSIKSMEFCLLYQTPSQLWSVLRELLEPNTLRIRLIAPMEEMGEDRPSMPRHAELQVVKVVRKSVPTRGPHRQTLRMAATVA
jgi:hypothetical protein